MKLLAIVNGASTGGKTARRWPEIEQALRSAGVEFDAVFTTTSRFSKCAGMA